MVLVAAALALVDVVVVIFCKLAFDAFEITAFGAVDIVDSVVFDAFAVTALGDVEDADLVGAKGAMLRSSALKWKDSKGISKKCRSVEMQRSSCCV